MTASLVKPAYLSVPGYTKTSGPEVTDLCKSVCYGPDPEQAMILDHIFGVDQNNKSTAFETGVIACRQNLKTGLFKQVTLGWLFITDERLIVWSAHEFKTSSEAMRDLTEIIDGSDMLRKRVKSILTSTGNEAIELKSGARVIFKTRTNTGGRGLSGNKVILDEGFALVPGHMGALLPTMSAQPDPQVLYGSSAGLAQSAVLRGVRDRGRKGGDPALAYFEWCAEDPAVVCALGDACSHSVSTEGCGCDDPANWRKSNPAIGRRITVQYIAKERNALPPDEFGRERMGWWDDPIEEEAKLSLEQWKSCKDLESEVKDPVAFGLHVSHLQKSSAIACCGRRADGLNHGEVIEVRKGTKGVVERLVELAEKWNPVALVLDPGSESGALIPELQRYIPELGRSRFTTEEPQDGQWRLVLVTAREYAQSCGALVKSVNDDLFRHRSQAELNSAVEHVKTRPLADAYAWSQKNSGVDIAPLVALTHAMRGFDVYGFDIPSEPFFMEGR